MKLYSAKVRIGGSLEHEVIKHNLTAAEITLLFHIHGGNHPTCVDIVHTADTNRSDAKERARLAAEYTKGELSNDQGIKLIQGLFGVNGALPQEYVPPVEEVEETVVPLDESDEEIVPVAAPKRTPLKADIVG